MSAQKHIWAVRLAPSEDFPESNSSKLIRTSILSDKNTCMIASQVSRKVIEATGDWMLKISRRVQCNGLQPEVAVVINYGAGYATVCLVDGAELPNNIESLPRVGVDVVVACVDSEKLTSGENRMDEYGVVTPEDEIRDHLVEGLSAHPDGVRIYLHTNESDLGWEESWGERKRMFRIWSRKDNRFAVRRIEEVQFPGACGEVLPTSGTVHESKSEYSHTQNHRRASGSETADQQGYDALRRDACEAKTRATSKSDFLGTEASKRSAVQKIDKFHVHREDDTATTAPAQFSSTSPCFDETTLKSGEEQCAPSRQGTASDKTSDRSRLSELRDELGGSESSQGNRWLPDQSSPQPSQNTPENTNGVSPSKTMVKVLTRKPAKRTIPVATEANSALIKAAKRSIPRTIQPITPRPTSGKGKVGPDKRDDGAIAPVSSKPGSPTIKQAPLAGDVQKNSAKAAKATPQTASSQPSNQNKSFLGFNPREAILLCRAFESDQMTSAELKRKTERDGKPFYSETDVRQAKKIMKSLDAEIVAMRKEQDEEVLIDQKTHAEQRGTSNTKQELEEEHGRENTDEDNERGNDKPVSSSSKKRKLDSTADKRKRGRPKGSKTKIPPGKTLVD